MSWDQRGHGDSQHAALYSWEADLRDAVHVFDSVGAGPVPVVGHSKGGSQMLQLADAVPHRVSHLVNIDGLPSRRSFPDVSDHQRTKLLEQELVGWLDHRRSLGTKQRRPGTIDELAERRGRMNPRLDPAWLRYLVTVGGREDADGWRWKIDPTIRFGGFGPWRPEWSMMRLPDIGVPVLAILGTEADPMGWGTPTDDVLSHLPPGGRLEVVERRRPLRPHRASAPRRRPRAGAPRMTGPTQARTTVRLLHNRVALALHELRAGDGRPLLHLHGLAERSPDAVPDLLAGWPGPVWALDLTGHGESDVAPGAGYFCEVLMGDVDVALAHLGPATLFGRGLGAYVGLLAAGGRPDLVRGTILFDGPGLAGGGPWPVSPFITTSVAPPPPGGTPDPWAVLELTRDVRPPDYASTFARQAATRSGLDVAIAVAGVNRVPWLEAVVAEPGVVECSVAEALALFPMLD